MNSPISCGEKPATRQMATGIVLNATTGLMRRSRIRTMMLSIMMKPSIVIIGLASFCFYCLAYRDGCTCVRAMAAAGAWTTAGN